MIRINGQELEAGGSLLSACRKAGARVDAFCHDDHLTPAGHCRACLVEVGGKLVAACTTPATDGLEVITDSPRLQAYHRDLGELMRTGADPGGQVGETLNSWGVTGDRYARSDRTAVHDTSHTYLRFDLDKCILCRLCLRSCEDIQGQFVYAIEARGHEARLAWGGTPFADTDCVACGACVSICPTGAITDRDRDRAAGRVPDRTVRTTCSYCGVGCQLDVHAAEDDVLWIDGSAAEVNHGHLCVKGRYAHGFAKHPDRLTTPLVRRGGVLEPASWDEAIAVVAEAFQRLRGSLAGLSSSRCTNEENYLVQKWFRAGLGTHDVDCCARVCHGPTAAGMRRSFGTGAATNSLEDLEIADVILAAGTNATAAHPVTGARLKQAVLRGAQLVVIDPRRTELAAMADVHLQLQPGTNVALLNALACALLEGGFVDHSFVAARTEGFEPWAAWVKTQTPERTEPITGVPAALVRRAAEIYGSAARPMQVHGLGMTEHFQGAEGVMLLCNLALLVGAIGREGVGVNPLRGQNNVQGAADMGCQPDLLTGYGDPSDPAVRARFEGVWGRPVPVAPGRTLPAIYAAVRSGEIRGMFVLGEDLVQTDPNQKEVVKVLSKLEMLVVQELFLTDTGRLAHVVLPGASFLEKDGTFTNGERRIQRVRKVIDPPGQALPDWKVLCALMTATGLPQFFASPADILQEVSRVAPNWTGVSFDRLEGDGLQWPVPTVEHPGTRLLHTGKFPRGRGAFTRVEYVPSPSFQSERTFTLVTGRVLEHYNNGAMTRRTENIDLAPADVLEIHPSDAADLNIFEGDRVRVTSDFGEAMAPAHLTDRVLPGNLFLSFHFPETGTNRVTSDVLDRIADCPEYKMTRVEIQKVGNPI